MTLQDIVKIFGDGNFKLCKRKAAIDNKLYPAKFAEKWLADNKDNRVGLWCPDGFIIVDMDSVEEAKILNKMTNTFKCKTRHGMHFYFKTDQEEKQRTNAHMPIGLKCDTRVANKGYCILPFNDPDREFISGKVEKIPYWVRPLKINSKAEQYIQANAKNGDGRNDSLIKHVMRLKKDGFENEQVYKICDLINKYVWEDSISNSELKSVLKSSDNYTPFEVKQLNKFWLYNPNGSVSGINHREIVDNIIKNYPIFTLGGVVYLYENGVFRNNSAGVRDIIKKLINHPKYQKQAQVKEVFNLLIDDVRIMADDSDCNKYSNFINFKNGMFDINTQKLYKHDPRYMATLQIPHNYVENKLDINDIQLMDFLKRTRLQKDDIDMILDFIAYCLTTKNGMKCFMCLVGGTDTGKSTLIKMINGLVGNENLSALSIQDMSKRFYPAQLKDKLVNSCADNSSLALNDIGNLKKITGDDVIMYEDKGITPYFFRPFAKLIFSFNALPLQLEEKSNAFYNRVRILHMCNRIKLTQTYVDDLCSPESVEGAIPVLCRRLKDLRKIAPSKKSLALTEKLRQDSDSVYKFIAKFTKITHNKKDYVEQEKLYSSYTNFCCRNDINAINKTKFARSLNTYNLELHSWKNKLYYVGIKIGG